MSHATTSQGLPMQAASRQTMKYTPIDLGRYLLWGVTALIMLVLPLIFKSSFALTLMSQMGTMIIFALAYNMLLGQSGMLSFGHAIYSGMGAIFTVHLLNMIGKGQVFVPLPLMPLVGGIAGAGFGLIFGYVTTKKAGTPFAMITLGLGEMVYAASLMFPDFFGGEGGVTTDRSAHQNFLGLTFGPQSQVYYLIAVWCFISMIAMYALTQTPLGRIANAVRDNPERAEFVGYNTQRVRWFTLILSAFFAGVGGALNGINFEIVSAENVSAVRSGGMLLATVIGGAGFFFGPILGACLFMFFVVALSDYSKAWLLYLGLFFTLMILFAPGGLASLILMQLPAIAKRQFRRLVKPYLKTGGAALILMAALILTVEMTYKLVGDSADGAAMTLLGIPLDVANVTPWVVAGVLWIVGGVLFQITRMELLKVWNAVQQDIHTEGGA
ncbi:MAG: branched-chain amino acid ABC transporter permease [Candidatus Protistobacter heckmanni]|nr:branched-chain amino acid ABC transporter permease [Candidatus Protistobacter heckmanni]